MRRFGLLLALPVLLLPTRARAVPALEFEARYFENNRQIAGHGFTSGVGSHKVDGAAYGIDRAAFKGGEISILGRGNVYAFGMLVGVGVAEGRELEWTGSQSHAVLARMGFEGRVTLSRQRFTGWFGGVLGLAIVGLNAGSQRVASSCRTCAASADRIEGLVEPRLGLEYAFVQGPYGRVATGFWFGAEPIHGAWSAGLSVSTRLNLIPGPPAP